jgi:hypothetical protein
MVAHAGGSGTGRIQQTCYVYLARSKKSCALTN